jgi:glycosyl transferase family 2
VKRTAAVFTIVQNEPAFLPVWARYYARHFAADDMFVLDHDSTDPLTVQLAAGLHRVPVHRAESFNHEWLAETVKRFQAFLLGSYELVLFTEVDEIVAANPERCPGGLSGLLDEESASDTPFLRCTGYDIVHDRHTEAALDWSQPVLAQRAYCRRSEAYSKPLLARRPLDWDIGFHDLVPAETPLPDPDPRLLLLHLHRADFGTCRAKTLENSARRWALTDLEESRGLQNRLVDEAAFERWFEAAFHDDPDEPLRPIPEAWRELV